MNAIDILGELLGHKTQQPSRGGNILKDIFGRETQRSASPPPEKPQDIHQQAKELEEFLNVANDRRSQRQSGGHQTSTRQTSTRQTSTRQSTEGNLSSENEKAMILLRAMINAAKADGKLDQGEQKKIMEQLHATDRETLDFLQREFSAPLDLNGFIRSVPIGMEQQVYTMSLIAIDLDTGTEADYLVQLSRGLRIPDDAREQIHQRLGAPSVY